MQDNDILITKVNEAYVKVHCERHIAQELSEYFTFSVPGHQFTPAFRNRIWDGKIRLLDLRNNQITHGLISYIEEFCKERDYTFEYGEPRADLTEDFSVYLAKKFIEELNLKLEVRDYQIDAFVHAIRNKRAVLLSPTASGKSLIIYLLVRQILDYQNLKGLIIVPTTSLCMQMKSDFVDYSSKNGFDVEDNVSIIMQGYTKYPTKKIIKITLLDGTIKKYKEHDVVKTQRGNILAKDVISSDDIL